MSFAHEQKPSSLKRKSPRLWFGEIGLIKTVLREQAISRERSGQHEQAAQDRLIVSKLIKSTVGLTTKIDWMPAPTLAEAVHDYVARSTDVDAQIMANVRVQDTQTPKIFLDRYISEMDRYDPKARAEDSLKAMQILERVSPEDYEAVFIELLDDITL